MAQFRTLTKAEEQIMQALWGIGEGFTKDIIDQLPEPKPHYNTVSTILKILTEKEFVTIENISKSHLYKPAVLKDAYSKQSMKRFIKSYFDGSFSNMLSFFAKEKDISVTELEEVLKGIKKTK